MQLPSLTTLLQSIDTLITELRTMRPLSSGELHELQKSLKVMEVYNSNAIEGNTLTLGETKLVIEDGITIGGKTLREIHEAINLSRAIEKILREKTPINESIIQELHETIMRNIDEENAGVYRKIQVYISGDEKKPPKGDTVPLLMRQLIQWYEASKNTLHPVLLAGHFHYQFVKIHPFVDGNGRTARLISNLMLIEQGYPMIIIPLIRRGEYISNLHSLTGNEEKFVNFYADIVHENLKDYMRMIRN